MTTPDAFPSGHRWVLHVPVEVDSIESAFVLIEVLAGVLAAQAPQVMWGDAEVSWEGKRARRIRVFCDRRLPDGTHCPMRYLHQGPCMPRERLPGYDGWTVIA